MKYGDRSCVFSVWKLVCQQEGVGKIQRRESNDGVVLMKESGEDVELTREVHWPERKHDEAYTSLKVSKSHKEVRFCFVFWVYRDIWCQVRVYVMWCDMVVVVVVNLLVAVSKQVFMGRTWLFFLDRCFVSCAVVMVCKNKQFSIICTTHACLPGFFFVDFLSYTE